MDVSGIQCQRCVDLRLGPIQGLGVGHAHPIVKECLSLQRQLIGGKVRTAELAATLHFRQFDLRRDGADDIARDLILQLEDILQLAVVFFTPYVTAAVPVEQLGGDPQAFAATPHAAFKQIADAQLAGDPSDVHRLALVSK